METFTSINWLQEKKQKTEKIYKKIKKNEKEYLVDYNHNSVDLFFYSINKAKKMLDSLKDCKNCEDCSNCENCENCYNCINCEDCKHLNNSKKSKNCLYGSYLKNTRNSINCDYQTNCINNIHCYNCENTEFSSFCVDSNNLFSCNDCKKCNDLKSKTNYKENNKKEILIIDDENISEFMDEEGKQLIEKITKDEKIQKKIDRRRRKSEYKRNLYQIQ